MSETRAATTILVVEDDDGHALLTDRVLRRDGFAVVRVATGRDCLLTLEAGLDAVVLLDLGLPDLPGMMVLERIVARSSETPVILVTGVDDLTVAVDAIRRGGWDYVVKRPDLAHFAELGHVISRNLDRQRLVRERNLFRSMLSHDIRNPLNVIFNYADMIADEPELSAGVRLLLQRIKDNAASTLNLVCNFVELGRIEGGTLALERQPICVPELAREIVERQDALATARGVTLRVVALPDFPAVPADMAYLERALTNLVSNAIKFSPDGGIVELRLTREGDRVDIAVHDTGSGIPADELPLIFEKYRRGRSSGAVEGSGLGLFIVRSVVEAHGGIVDVASQVGVGSTFTIRLPLLRVPEAVCAAAL